MEPASAWLTSPRAQGPSTPSILPAGRRSRPCPCLPGRGEGLCFDGLFLYYSVESRIYKIDPATGAVVHSFPPPGGRCHALAFVRGYLLSGNSGTGIITVFDRFTLAIEGTIAAPGGGAARVEGLAFDPARSELFIANQSENRIYVGRVAL